MRPPTTVGRDDLSSTFLPAAAAISGAWAAQRPICHATGLADVLRCGDHEAQAMVRDLTDGGWLLPTWVLVPLRWDLDWPPLDPDPARPTAEERRHRRDRALHEWVLDFWRHGYWPGNRCPSMLGSELVLRLPGQTRRDHLARLRDPARAGGAVLAPHGALAPAAAVAELARVALLGDREASPALR